ncbi:hypothetical protein BJ508DRAFT_334319 [Ascobolus immersus RN42]|uniref:Tc1-like transposase DDE domain-containing protein n=1 Tax=Ascobolus immersus RN42 TaxID=1160509 RepID=A0A3N4HGI2_ASCIM|nr:hypothetical protein BJ508DRAFT_334319 [Ascobolus immersus RN42]
MEKTPKDTGKLHKNGLPVISNSIGSKDYLSQVLKPVVGPAFQNGFTTEGGNDTYGGKTRSGAAFKAALKRYKAEFIEDSAPVHGVRNGPCSLAETKRALGIPFHWRPSYSPDLNPIENVWRIMKQRIKARMRFPGTLEEMKKAVQEEWDRLIPEDWNKHIDSMPQRLKSVKERNANTLPFTWQPHNLNTITIALRLPAISQNTTPSPPPHRHHHHLRCSDTPQKTRQPALPLKQNHHHHSSTTAFSPTSTPSPPHLPSIFLRPHHQRMAELGYRHVWEWNLLRTPTPTSSFEAPDEGSFSDIISKKWDEDARSEAIRQAWDESRISALDTPSEPARKRQRRGDEEAPRAKEGKRVRVVEPPEAAKRGPVLQKRRVAEQAEPRTAEPQTSPFFTLPPELQILVAAHLRTPRYLAATCWRLRRLLHPTRSSNKSFFKLSTSASATTLPVWRAIALARTFRPSASEDTPALMPEVLTSVEEVGVCRVEVDEVVVKGWAEKRGGDAEAVGKVLREWEEMWVFAGAGAEGVVDYGVLLRMGFGEVMRVPRQLGGGKVSEALELVVGVWLRAARVEGVDVEVEEIQRDVERGAERVEGAVRGSRWERGFGCFKVGQVGLRVGAVERLNELVRMMPGRMVFRKVRVSREGQLRVEGGEVKDWKGEGGKGGLFKEGDLANLVLDLTWAARKESREARRKKA